MATEERAVITSAFGLIFDEQNRVLLCHRTDYDLWNLPGGAVEAGEAPWEGAIREVKEEVGLDVTIIKPTGIYYRPESKEIVFVFLCQVIGGKLTLSFEADEIKYFAFDDIPVLTVKNHILRIKDYLDNREKVVIRYEMRQFSFKEELRRK